MEKNVFIIRVYGIYIDEKRRLLLSDEFVFKQVMTKFPGGGLEYGEGTIACLKRELLEETGQEFVVLEHFYTTDFFVASAFHDDKQLISVYYLVKPKKELALITNTEKNNFSQGEERKQSFRWFVLKDLTMQDLTFPIDQHVAGLLIERNRNK